MSDHDTKPTARQLLLAIQFRPDPVQLGQHKSSSAMLQLTQPDQMGQPFGVQVLVPRLDHTRHILRAPMKRRKHEGHVKSNIKQREERRTYVVTPSVHFTLAPSGPGFHEGSASKRKTASAETIVIQRDASAMCFPALVTGSAPLETEEENRVPDTPTEPECKGDVVGGSTLLLEKALGLEFLWFGELDWVLGNRPGVRLTHVQAEPCISNVPGIHQHSRS